MDGLTSARVIEFGGERLIVSSTRDVTEQLALQAELERQREIAHQNEKLSALGGVLAGVAHELNNPLSIVVANAMMLQDGIVDPRTRKRIDRIAVAASRSARIVKTFLAMARNRPQKLVPTPAGELIYDALDVAAYGLRSLGTEIEVTLAEDLPAIAVDPDQIVQVFSNVIVNAEHAMTSVPGPHRLRITADLTAAAMVRFTFEDTGPGVPDEIVGRIFEPYFTTKEVSEGTGVGLAYSQRIVRSHDGRIDVGRSPGGGASVTVELPVARMASPAPSPPPAVRHPRSCPRGRRRDGRAGNARRCAPRAPASASRRPCALPTRWRCAAKPRSTRSCATSGCRRWTARASSPNSPAVIRRWPHGSAS